MGTKTILTVEEVSGLINQNKNLVVAGDEALLKQLPKGNWIGGTIPYFIGDDGGLCTKTMLHVTEFPVECKLKSIKQYKDSELSNIMKDYPENGFSYIIIPATSNSHTKFANEVTTYDGLFNSPLVGWISGVHLDDLGSVAPKVFNGQTSEFSEADAIVFHVDLVDGYYPKTEIINLFTQGGGDSIEFVSNGFEVKEAKVNGETVNFAKYLTSNSIGAELPLVANYSGAMVNVSFQNIDIDNGVVQLYAPVFEGMQYKIAKPVADYKNEFESVLKKNSISPIFSCNCILNYLYAELEGKKPGDITGPITFGEIAYMLLNQTMVYVTLEKK